MQSRQPDVHEIVEGCKDRHKTQLMQEFFNLSKNLANLNNRIYGVKQFEIDLDESLIESKILTILSANYEHFKTAWESTPKQEKTLNNIKLRLIKEYKKRNLFTHERDAFEGIGYGMVAVQRHMAKAENWEEAIYEIIRRLRLDV